MKNLYKNLKIKEDTHKMLKIYCAKNSLKINEFVNEIIKKEIQKSCLKN